MSERSWTGRRRAFAALSVVAIWSGLGLVVPTAASAVGTTSPGPTTDTSTVRLSVVPRSSVFGARQSTLSALRDVGLRVAAAGPARPAGPAYQLEVPTSELPATLSVLRASGSVQSVEPVHA